MTRQLGEAEVSSAATAMPVTAESELHQHQRKHDHAEAEKVTKNEGAAAVGADFVRKFPDAAEPDRRADGSEDEAAAARPKFTFA